jgi:nucleotide-binding universal stress UspA family protein
MFSRSYGRVIAGVSGSPCSLHALRHAVGLARAFEAPLLPVLAWEAPGGERQARIRPVPELEREWERGAETRLEAAIEQGLGAMPPDIDSRPQIVRGPTGRSLVRLANWPDDLLVVGTGRHGAIARSLHSHVAGYCVAHAVCCVLAVPPPPLAGVRGNLRHLTVWNACPRSAATGDLEGDR